MKKRSLVTAAAVAACLGLVTLPAQAADEGFTVENGTIYDANGQQFIPQGVNLPYAWYTDESQSFADARNAGANAVRVVLSGGRWGTTSASEVSSIIQKCKDNQLVCILENHDTTGYLEDSSATSLSAAADYWSSVASAIEGQEKYVMINIGNEPYGNTDTSGWASDTISAVDKVRTAGIDTTLIVDAPNWGQDWSYTMRDNAAAVAAADGNLVFDVHMYGVFDTASAVTSYLDSFTRQNLAVMVGEFANHHASGTPDADTIMSYTRSQGIGLLAWSWSGNSGEDIPLDLVANFNGSTLTPWGERFINGADGLKQRSPQTASVYTSTTYPTCSTSSSDPDGDGWGWENNASCKVADATSGSTAPNGYPYCSTASADPDGDGWGWENSASCVVSGSLADA
ncbi:cellulase family glycosylhydrolase [Glutamicibacter sp. X7]